MYELSQHFRTPSLKAFNSNTIIKTLSQKSNITFGLLKYNCAMCDNECLEWQNNLKCTFCLSPSPTSFDFTTFKLFSLLMFTSSWVCHHHYIFYKTNKNILWLSCFDSLILLSWIFFLHPLKMPSYWHITGWSISISFQRLYFYRLLVLIG